MDVCGTEEEPVTWCCAHGNGSAFSNNLRGIFCSANRLLYYEELDVDLGQNFL
jgi:hypothetical protein